MWMSPGSRPSHGTRPTSTSTTPTRAIRRPKAMRILPTSFTTIRSRLFEESRLARSRGSGLLARLGVRRGGQPTNSGRRHDEADLKETALDHHGQRLRLVVDGGRDRLQVHP